MASDAGMSRDAGTVLAHGTFDIFHPGHLALLEAAATLGARLVVSVSDDPVVRAQKGPPRPIFPIAERVAMLRALTIVNEVVISHSEDAVDVIRRLKPSVYVKGADYLDGDPTGRLERERLEVEAHGGRLEILDTWPRYSSTAIAKALA